MSQLSLSRCPSVRCFQRAFQLEFWRRDVWRAFTDVQLAHVRVGEALGKAVPAGLTRSRGGRNCDSGGGSYLHHFIPFRKLPYSPSRIFCSSRRVLSATFSSLLPYPLCSLLCLYLPPLTLQLPFFVTGRTLLASRPVTLNQTHHVSSRTTERW